MSTASELRKLPYFDKLDDSVVEAVGAMSETIDVPAGTILIEEGSTADQMYVIVDGHLEVTKQNQGREVVLANLGPGNVVGEMAMLDGAPRTATVRAAQDASLISVPQEAMEDLLSDPGLVRRMIQTVTSRLRDIEDTLRHEERMSALGRMAAQLMHELNNPAAAVGRSSQALLDVYKRLGDAAMSVAGSGADLEGRLSDPDKPEALSPLERSEAEATLEEWLEGHQITEPWQLAPALAADGWTVDVLENAIAGLSSEQGAAVAEWIGLRCLASQIIREVQIGAGRISELVRVVKEYSYVDQAPVQVINPTSGISDTLILLKYKLRSIEVVTDFADNLHLVEVSGRDLNQVWTNLIDNAADAMPDGGKLTITAVNDGDEVLVTVADTGSGIDDETIERVFDPFFTTKEPGKGTGLGLHTVHTIIARAGGAITAESNGGTTFAVRLPGALSAPTD
jgi:signal transduction histidine kinase